VGRARTHLAAFYHDIRACQKYADACARIAGRTADANTRDDFLRLQRCWLRLEKYLVFAARPRLSAFCPKQPMPTHRPRDRTLKSSGATSLTGHNSRQSETSSETEIGGTRTPTLASWRLSKTQHKPSCLYEQR
jgi:hypothetical protein